MASPPPKHIRCWKARRVPPNSEDTLQFTIRGSVTTVTSDDNAITSSSRRGDLHDPDGPGFRRDSLAAIVGERNPPYQVLVGSSVVTNHMYFPPADR